MCGCQSVCSCRHNSLCVLIVNKQTNNLVIIAPQAHLATAMPFAMPTAQAN